MAQLELRFESGEDSLSVRRFEVREVMSGLFSVSVWARSPHEDIDLETIVGHEASLRIASGLRFALSGERSFHGLCCHMEQMQAEVTGLSSYYLQIVPRLWLLGQRMNHRLFQHQSIPEIVSRLLGEWSVPHRLALDVSTYPKLELRTQYGESDLSFLSRLLEEAGIAYYFEEGSALVLVSAPQAAEPRMGGPIGYVDHPSTSAEREYVTDVRLSQRVRPGKVTLRDHDFRRRPTFPLFGQLGAKLESIEERLEVYRYVPGAFLVELDAGELGKLGEVFRGVMGEAPRIGGLVDAAEGVAGAARGGVSGLGQQALDLARDKVEGYVQDKGKGVLAGIAEKAVGRAAGELGELGGKVAEFGAGKLMDLVSAGVGRLFGDDKGFARFTEKAGARRAQLGLEAMRVGRRAVAFRTNVMDLSPGTVFSMDAHARRDLGPSEKLLVVSFAMEGTHDGEWSMSGEAVFAALPYRPAQQTPKPSILGLQSAVVVGPDGEEIHTDEHGRVRVQFHWDRGGIYDDDSSCWMRVSQGWAGAGFGLVTIPRVGQEVLVGFLEGDPDHPVVVGRLFNGTSRPPYDLPRHKTRSGWRSDSTPGSGGYNEIMFEDAKGRELVYVQAERDLESVVKRNEARSVGEDRRTSIGAVDESHVGVRHNVTMRQGEATAGKVGPTFFEMVDGRIVFSTGEASITLDGPNITLEAKGRIFVHSKEDDVEILGGPWVKINCGPVPEGESDTVTMHHITGILRDQDGEPLPGWKVVVQGSDGGIQQVETDKTGRYFALVPPGKCKVSLPGGWRYGAKGSILAQMTSEAAEFRDDGPAAPTILDSRIQ